VSEPVLVDDRALVRRAAAGDAEAFAALVARWSPRLYRLARARGLCPADAEAVAQDACIRAHAHLACYDARWSVATWLCTIAHRLASNALRDRAAAPAPLTHDHVAPEPAPDDTGVWAVARAHLDERAVAALWLHYVEGLAPAEVARALGVTALHARVILHRARNRLAAILRPAPATIALEA
jgi:RNA polymerase sigma-70 factor (ECF subfamily)